MMGCDAFVAPSDPVFCTQIGCDSQVLLELSADLEPGRTYEVEACLDDFCESAMVEVPPPGVGVSDSFVVDVATDVVAFVLPEADYSGVHRVTLALRGGGVERIEIEAETEFERSQPNGRNCPPICWQAIIRA